MAVDRPGDDQPARWFPGQHPVPVALAAIHALLVPAATFPGSRMASAMSAWPMWHWGGHQVLSEPVKTWTRVRRARDDRSGTRSMVGGRMEAWRGVSREVMRARATEGLI